MTAPVAVNENSVGVTYGYTMNSSPATIYGHRCSFFPYTRSTNPMPPGMSDTSSHVASRVNGEPPGILPFADGAGSSRLGGRSKWKGYGTLC